MYIPKHFSLDVASAVSQLERTNVFDLITVTGAGMVATFLPLIYVARVENGTLGSMHGHLARANAQWKDSLATVDALVIANSYDAYVSPTAYPSKRIDGKVVPTWNYETVHAYGTFIVHDDPKWTRDLVDRLTIHHEAAHASLRDADTATGQPWSITDAPAAYIDSMLRAIVGIEVQLTRVEGKSKLSQNKSESDRIGVIDDLALGHLGEQTIATRMRTSLNQ